MKKKVVALFLTLVIMTSFALAGCGQQTEGNKSTKQNTEKSTVETSGNTSKTGGRTKITALLKELNQQSSIRCLIIYLAIIVKKRD